MACADNAQLLINRLREEGVVHSAGKRATAKKAIDLKVDFKSGL